jgi:hypothetical protein
MVQCFAACSAAFLTACTSTGGTTASVPVAPMCTILAVNFSSNPQLDMAFVSERTDSTVNHGFARFRQIASPRGNSAVGSVNDVYAISEAWSRNSAGPVVYRAQAHPAPRRTPSDFKASAWSINTQDARGTWSTPIGPFSANSGNEEDAPAAGGLTGPQLMPVGVANSQVFGCAGARSADNAVRSTWLIEATAGNAATGTRGDVMLIQDLLSGDDRFVPNAPGPLIGPSTPPTPTITGRPGHPVREGAVQCAMTQLEDNLATRELHMLAISNGVLYHSMANNFGPAATAPGGARFRAVSQWGDVSQALGRSFGNIIAAAIVGRPTSVEVLFVAESGGLHKLWRATRFSGSGSWRPADDVFVLNDTWISGRIRPFRVAAGMCPALEDPQSSELIYTMWSEVGDDREVALGRIVSTPRTWFPGMHGIYSHFFGLSQLIGQPSASRQDTINSMVIVARPFADDARPPSP